MSLFTFSGAGTAMACPASAVLPHAGSVHEGQRRGSALATFAARLETMDRQAALALAAPEDRASLAMVDADAIRGEQGTWSAEVAFSYDLLTGEAHEIGRGLERGYAAAARQALGRDLRASEVTGTADMLALTDDRVVVADDKRGQQREVAAAARNWQVIGLALAAAHTYGRSAATVQIQRVLTDGTSWLDSAELDAWDLDQAAQDLEQLYHRIEAERPIVAAWQAGEGPPPVVTTGSHCRWCPALVYCPAQTSLIRAVVREAEVGAGAYATPLDDDELALGYQRVKAAKRLIEEMEQVLYRRAAQRPFALLNGRWLGPVSKPRNPKVDGAGVWAALAARFDEATAEAAAPAVRKATLTSIDSAIREKAERGKWAQLQREVHADLVAAGLVVRTDGISIEEHRATPEAVARMIAEREAAAARAEDDESRSLQALLNDSLEAP